MPKRMGIKPTSTARKIKKRLAAMTGDELRLLLLKLRNFRTPREQERFFLSHGLNARRLKARDITVKDLLEYCCPRTLILLGFGFADLKRAKCKPSEMKEAGASIFAFQDQGFTAREAKGAKYLVLEVVSAYSYKGALEAGFSQNEVNSVSPQTVKRFLEQHKYSKEAIRNSMKRLKR